MLLNANISNSFRNALKLRLFIGIMIIIVGVKSISLVILSQIGDLNSMTSKFGIEFVNLDFMKGFYTGFGGALIAVGIFMIFRCAILLKNPDKFKKAEINYLDERNRFIKSMTFNATSYIFLIALALAVVISGMFNTVVFVSLICTLVAYMLILLVSYIVVRSAH